MPRDRRAAVLRAIPEPLLDINEIQGNILAGFNKDQQCLIALRIRGVPEARRWLARILPHISTLSEVYQFNALFRMKRARLGHDPIGLTATWMNIAFSRDGLARLSSDTDANALPDTAFRVGLNKDRSLFLGDPTPAGETDKKAEFYWAGVDPDGSYKVLGKGGGGIPPGKYRISVTLPPAFTNVDKLRGAFGPDNSKIIRDIPGGPREQEINIDLANP